MSPATTCCVSLPFSLRSHCSSLPRSLKSHLFDSFYGMARSQKKISRDQKKKKTRLFARLKYVESCVSPGKSIALILKRLILRSSFKSVKNADLFVFLPILRGNIEERRSTGGPPQPNFLVFAFVGHGSTKATRIITQHLYKLAADVMKRLVENSWMAHPQIASVGSSCLVGAISGDLLYVVNLGDSRAVLGRRLSDRNKGPVVVERFTTGHNVVVEEVRKEVEALHPHDAHVVVYTRGVWRIKGFIQVSRSIGDVYLKKPEFHRAPLFQQFGAPVPLKRAVMTAEASIQIRKLRPQDLFLIFASDGLWEQLSDEEVVFKSPRSGIAKHLVRAARKRETVYDDTKKTEKGVRRHFHDDITVIVFYLDHHQGIQKGRSKEHGNFDSISSPADIFSQNIDDSDDRALNPIS